MSKVIVSKSKSKNLGAMDKFLEIMGQAIVIDDNFKDSGVYIVDKHLVRLSTPIPEPFQ